MIRENFVPLDISSKVNFFCGMFAGRFNLMVIWKVLTTGGEKYNHKRKFAPQRRQRL